MNLGSNYTLPMTNSSATNLPLLNLKTAPQEALLLQQTPTTGIVHIGLGNFHRAHLAVYTALAVQANGGDWGIFAYSMRSTATPDSMTAQDNLYSVVTISPDSDQIIIPAIHTKVLGGPERVGEVLREIAQSATKIITLTVTEAGYSISQETNGLDLGSPDIQWDLTHPATPKTAIGIIVRGLQLRAQSHKSPITVLSCDNLSSNGNRTAQLVGQFVAALPEFESQELDAYISTSVTFPNSMVDRIVPGTQPRHIEMVANRLGVHDQSPVPAEAFTMWVLEDNFAAGRPDWEINGAIFTKDVEGYEVMKLRLLNGAHSLLSYLGALAGEETIPGARFLPFVEQALQTILYKEFLPTFTLPIGVEADKYIAQLFSRWSNTVLGDLTSRVGSDGSTKLPQRITQPVLFHALNQEIPQYIALTIAAWLACIAPLAGFEPGKYADAMKDPAKENLVGYAASSTSPSDFVRWVFTGAGIFAPELATLSEFHNQISIYLDLIMREGIEAASKYAHSLS